MYISIDIGGTNTKVASSKNLREIVDFRKFPTQSKIEDQRSILVTTIDELLGQEKVEGICMGVPGLIDKKNNKLSLIINVPYLSYLSYSQVLSEKYDPNLVIAENDASLAGLGHAVFGEGRDFEVVVYLTLSTGVGGVRISNKRIDPSQRYSEPGHMIIHPQGRKFDLCGQEGCLCAYVSGTAFEQIYGVSPIACEEINVWKDYAKNLSVGIINILAMWAPDVIILGGSLTRKYDSFIKAPLFEELSKQALFAVPPIVPSIMEGSSGVSGGFALLSQKFNIT